MNKQVNKHAMRSAVVITLIVVIVLVALAIIYVPSIIQMILPMQRIPAHQQSSAIQ